MQERHWVTDLARVVSSRGAFRIVENPPSKTRHRSYTQQVQTPIPHHSNEQSKKATNSQVLQCTYAFHTTLLRANLS